MQVRPNPIQYHDEPRYSHPTTFEVCFMDKQGVWHSTGEVFHSYWEACEAKADLEREGDRAKILNADGDEV